MGYATAKNICKSSPPRGEDLRACPREGGDEGAAPAQSPPHPHPHPHPLPLPKRAREKGGWSPERKARQSLRIRLWAPWARSTGPKTPAGKEKSARNSYKHGARAMPMRMVNQALAAQRRFRQTLLLLHSLKKQNMTNELLKPLYPKLNLYDRIFRVRLWQYLILEEIAPPRRPPSHHYCNFSLAAV